MLLVVDHHDSFTWNLVHLLAQWADEVQVIQSDETTASAVRALRPDGIVLSPGPGRPEQALASLALVRELAAELPMLGVCLGHQVLCAALGARVTHAASVRHGRVSEIHHDATGIFAGLPTPFRAARYHSLIVDAASLPAELVPQAFTDSGELMAVRHKRLPLHSVQFHPESFLTEHGQELVRAFVAQLSPGSRVSSRPVSLGLP